jgi:threonylcarbamoyladenosine tRNA methylthiotransferase MtaB
VKYSVITFGCRVNQADSLRLEEELQCRGGEPGEAEQADIVVVNTCSVTASADQAARQTIRRIGRINPKARVVVTGCYASRRPGDVAGLPGVLRVVSNDDKSRLIPLAFPELTTAERYGAGEGSCGGALAPGIGGRTAFTLRVQTGCAEACSFCIIPTTRGRPRSLGIAEVVGEAGRVAAAGFKEIVLTGVHLGSYGRDLEPPSSLAELLASLMSARGRCDGGRPSPDVLFRISSLEPMDCTEEIVELVAAGGCFAPHFHLPLQHASDRMLAAMCRPYTLERYRGLVDSIRQRIPHASIGCDIIVGFPGESDHDFEELCAYLESSPLTHLHVFPYSDRAGTVAAAREDKVAGPIVRERAHAVRDIGHRLAAEFRRTQIGTLQRALTIDDGSIAVTGNYLKISIPPGRRRNEWVEVRITSQHEGELLGG